MKLSEIFGLAFIVFIAWPWAVGLIDLTAWLVTGNQLSAIPWASNRGFMAAVWPVLWVLVLAGVSS
jgi:hypothetical protein